ncbi:MAG: hypothetical protein JWQ67_232, partial [Marmoricola sp.]|nr:hypothetical protein [Marmoricola sp.]
MTSPHTNAVEAPLRVLVYSDDSDTRQ